MNRTQTRPAAEVQVALRGGTPHRAAEYARAKLGPVVGRLREPVLGVRVKLTQGNHPSAARPAVAEVSVDVGGRLVRAHVGAPTMTEAIDLLRDRLAGRLDRATRRRDTARRTEEPAQRPDRRPRPAEERRIVRRKSFDVAPEPVDEAVFEMEALDHDFRLFTDATTGLDAVVHRTGPAGYHLTRTGPAPEGAAVPAGVPLTVGEVPAPRIEEAEAVRWLELTGLPFVFFADVATGRGAVLYHRYDGHYGLITPAE
ncbi:ribosome hibernation promotion factor [Peterkaempfera bronchialis]|uniref:ribosome hibernation promotion factor n=1 Tax=Peterkaempfera bronchialis TaxID=2126346 RepID=UPI003C2DB085